MFCALAGVARAQGPVFVVNTNVDAKDAVIDGVCETAAENGFCSLRAAVMEANADASGEEVTIRMPAGTHTFLISIGSPDDARNGDLNLLGKVRIVGAGGGMLDDGKPVTTVDSNHLDRVFYVASGAAVVLEDLKIQGGRPPDLAGHPGSNFGGGIYSAGSLTIRRCLVRMNEAGGSGGGVYASGSASPLTIEDSVFRVNLAAANAGGIGTFLSQTVEILRSTVHSNTALGSGAGLFLGSPTIRITNSTIADNTASGGGGGLEIAGSSDASLNNVTVAVNRASHTTRGAGLLSFASAVKISNSVFDNYDPGTLFYDDIACSNGGTVVSNGYLWINSAAPCVTGTWQMGGAFLAPPPLANNGGLLVTSMVGGDGLDAGDPAGCADAFGAPLSTDQRGVTRVIGVACDVGAVEKEPVGDANGDGFVNVSDILYLINHLFAGGPNPAGRADVNADVTVNVSDVLYLINYLFAGGPAPVE